MSGSEVVNNLQQHSMRFSREAAAGYDREVIKNVDIVLVGAGALGQFCAMCLALIGFPHVLIVDMDSFEESNITRSPFFKKGEMKARANTE